MAEPSAIDLDAIRARYARIGTPKLLWQEVCIDIAAMADEIEALRAEVHRLRLNNTFALPLGGTGSLRMCPRSERPCGLGCNADQCVLGLCRHLRTLQAVVGDVPGFTRVQTSCIDCGAVLP